MLIPCRTFFSFFSIASGSKDVDDEQTAEEEGATDNNIDSDQVEDGVVGPPVDISMECDAADNTVTNTDDNAAVNVAKATSTTSTTTTTNTVDNATVIAAPPSDAAKAQGKQFFPSASQQQQSKKKQATCVVPQSTIEAAMLREKLVQNEIDCKRRESDASMRHADVEHLARLKLLQKQTEAAEAQTDFWLKATATACSSSIHANLPLFAATVDTMNQTKDAAALLATEPAPDGKSADP